MRAGPLRNVEELNRIGSKRINNNKKISEKLKKQDRNQEISGWKTGKLYRNIK